MSGETYYIIKRLHFGRLAKAVRPFEWHAGRHGIAACETLIGTSRVQKNPGGPLTQVLCPMEMILEPYGIIETAETHLREAVELQTACGGSTQKGSDEQDAPEGSHDCNV